MYIVCSRAECDEEGCDKSSDTWKAEKSRIDLGFREQHEVKKVGMSVLIRRISVRVLDSPFIHDVTRL